MNLILYLNTSDTKRINKITTEIKKINGVLRYPTSILNPIFEIELDSSDIEYIDSSDVTQTISLFNLNYAYVTEFNRYYYIDTISCNSFKLYVLTLRVDVLNSFKNEFMNLYAILDRTSNYNYYDASIEDNEYSYKYNKKISYYTITNLSTIKEFTTRTIAENTVLTYMTDDTLYYSNSPIAIDNLPIITSYVSSANTQTQYLVMTNGAVRDLVKNFYKNDTLIGYVKSCVVYPFTIPYYSNTSISTIKIGSTSITLSETYKYPQYYPYRFVNADFTFPYPLTDTSSFLNYSPYIKTEIYLPYYGYVELNGEEVFGCEIKVIYMVNFEDNSSYVYIYNVDSGYIIFEAPCTLGIKVPLSSTNATELKNEQTSLGINTTLNTLGSIISMSSGVATGNAYAVGTGAINLASTLGNAYTNYNKMYSIGNSQSISSLMGSGNLQEVHIKFTKCNSISSNNSLNNYRGKPSKAYIQLSNLTTNNFFSVSQIKLESISATETEKQEIEMLLKNGVYV